MLPGSLGQRNIRTGYEWTFLKRFLAMAAITYKDSGVDLEAAQAVASSVSRLMRSTFDPRVIGTHAGFAGLFALDYSEKLFARNYKRPVLAACTDGVGTKLRVAFKAGVHNTVGIDLVAMSVNDLVTLGAEPLFFLDYVALPKFDEKLFSEIVSGVVEGCRRANTALIGGETAEMPGFYKRGEYDLVGFAVGVLDRPKLLDGSKVRPGDVIIGLPSSGLHSNGFSLVRKALLEERKMRLDKHVPELGRTLGEELLEPTRIYVRPIRALLSSYKVKKMVRAIAHITGGGWPDNLVRVLPKGCVAEIERKSWEVPPIFGLVQKCAEVEDEEMYRVFNMGMGMALIVSPVSANVVLRKLKRERIKGRIIGRVVRGKRSVRLL